MFSWSADGGGVVVTKWVGMGDVLPRMCFEQHKKTPANIEKHHLFIWRDTPVPPLPCPIPQMGVIISQKAKLTSFDSKIKISCLHSVACDEETGGIK